MTRQGGQPRKGEEELDIYVDNSANTRWRGPPHQPKGKSKRANRRDKANQDSALSSYQKTFLGCLTFKSTEEVRRGWMAANFFGAAHS